MSMTSLDQQAVGMADIGNRLAFSKKLQNTTNKIHAAKCIDEILTEVSSEICDLFAAQRITLYLQTEDGKAIVSKIKTGLNQFKELKLAITQTSIAGYVALNKCLLNIADVYDDAELLAISPSIQFLKEVDLKTGFHAKQMLVFPILAADDGRLIGVVQLINSLSGLPFSRLLEEGAPELAKTLAIAFDQRQAMPLIKSKFDGLLSAGHLNQEELASAQRLARSKGSNLESVLIADYQVQARHIGGALSEFFNVPYEPYQADRLKPVDLLKQLKQEYVEANAWLPISLGDQDSLVILTPDPERIKSSGIVSHVFPRYPNIRYCVCLQQEFMQTVEQFYGSNGTSGFVGDLLSEMADEEELSSLSADEVNMAADNELVKLVNKIVVDAYNQGASDIHIEPYPEKGKTQIRFRKDGTLVNYIEVPASYRNALCARIKIMCDLDISEKRRPQDGKIKFKKYGPLDIELRVATIPSAGGMEDIVMRILSAGKPIPLDELGLSDWNNQQLKSLISKPYGLFFVCGPTGSGKTTTLHSALGYINTPETKIWTAEDPVEITQKGLRQVQVNKKAGLDFSTIMRAFLRADPDVIMVGEMRDKETVATGIEASLTGHLVFATLHTNSAPESVVRLLDMGMDPFNFADALLGILAQRLAKRLCECKQPYQASLDEMQLLVQEYSEELKNTAAWQRDPQASEQAVLDGWQQAYADGQRQFTLYRPGGCDKCNGTGYKGRLGLHELMLGSDAVKKNIQERARVADIVATALDEGMRTLKQDGIEKVLLGLTDMHQVRAVCIK
ncbi:PulE Type II secretory pathway, ATPase PulE/Tfp pilus assembly pathway, ATPase PilB [Methylophilaceae bacterium]